MASSDETIKLALQIEGQEKAEQLRAKVEALRTQLLASGTASGFTSKATLQLADDMHHAGAEADALDMKFGKAGRGAGGMTNAVQGSSRAFQDFVSASKSGGFSAGLNAITNNVDQVAQGFGRLAGASPAMATAIGSIGTFAIVGLQLLIPVATEIARKIGLIGGEVPPVETAVASLTRRIKELSAHPITVQADANNLRMMTEELKKLTTAQEAYNEAKGLESKATRASKAAIKGHVEEMGAGEVVKDIAGDIFKRKSGESSDLTSAGQKIKKTLAVIASFKDGGISKDDQARLDARLKKELDEQKGIVDDLRGQSEGEAGTLVKGDDPELLARALERVDRKGLAGEVRSSTPAAMAKQAEEDAHDDAVQEDLKASGKSMAERSKKHRAAAKQAAREEQQADDDDAEQKQHEAVEGGKLLVKQRHDRERKAKAAEHQAKVDASLGLHAATKDEAAAQSEAKRLAAGTNIDEAAGQYLQFQAMRRSKVDAMSDEGRAKAIRAAERGGNPILSAEQASARAEAEITRRLRGAVDANGLPIANTPGVAKAMIGDIQGMQNRNALNFAPGRVPIRNMQPGNRVRPGGAASAKPGGNPDQKKQLQKSNDVQDEILRTLKTGTKLLLSP